MFGRIMLLAGAALFAGGAAQAKEIVVQMKNQGAAGIMVFEPAYVQADVGDRVHFVPTDAGHNAEPIAGMLPEGVTAPAGAINAEYVLTLAKPGLYGIKCKPHLSMGMVALVKAGRGPPANLAAAQAAKLPPLAQKRMAAALQMAMR